LEPPEKVEMSATSFTHSAVGLSDGGVEGASLNEAEGLSVGSGLGLGVAFPFPLPLLSLPSLLVPLLMPFDMPLPPITNGIKIAATKIKAWNRFIICDL